MKTTLSLLAVLLACAGCGNMPVDLSGYKVKGIDLGQAVSTANKVGKAVEGQRDLTEPEEIALGEGVAICWARRRCCRTAACNVMCSRWA
jgi:hypothetical protein